ncbi:MULTISPECIES: class I adenylate-forming enzyme family protein [unclassified Nocardioides]|uniref:class I adenylate-forming enzyme family protein n=1 Tax=unclassified Nocardioides TaxID=2615069 RepID=UPI0009E7207C|nr:MULTISPECIES: AMP-binding protein [unclassified Nocardioides]
MVTNANIATALWDSARQSPSVTALSDLTAGSTRSYADLRDACAEVAAGWRGRGLVPGDRVALLLHNSCEYVEAFLGSLAAGLVVVPLNTRLTVPDFAHMLRDAEVSALVTDAAFLAELRSDSTIQVPLVVDVTGTSEDAVSLADLRAPDDGREPEHKQPSDLCSLMYTSGTTGAPKAVMLSHRSWSSVSDTCVELLGFEEGISIMHPAPLTHGAGFLLIPTLRHHGTNLLVRSFDPRDTADRIASGEAQGMFLVPSMIRMLLDSLPESWQPSSRFRWIYYAGSPIDPTTFVEAAQAFGGRLVQSFAQMESPMFLTALDAEVHLRAMDDPDSPLIRSAGKLIEGREIRIVDADGHDAATGVAGEVWGKAPQLMSGYWNRPEDSEKALAGGWLHTGDVGYLDEEGYLYLVDRVKDMIVTGGSNVYAREVEDVLIAVEGVERAAVIGLPHRIWGEEVTAVLVRADGASLDEDTVIASCRQALAGYKVPKRIVWLDELPTNAYGKVLKRSLRSDLAEQLAASAG